jgi:hypothetical protein
MKDCNTAHRRRWIARLNRRIKPRTAAVSSEAERRAETAERNGRNLVLWWQKRSAI